MRDREKLRRLLGRDVQLRKWHSILSKYHLETEPFTNYFIPLLSLNIVFLEIVVYLSYFKSSSFIHSPAQTQCGSHAGYSSAFIKVTSVFQLLCPRYNHQSLADKLQAFNIVGRILHGKTLPTCLR